MGQIIDSETWSKLANPDLMKNLRFLLRGKHCPNPGFMAEWRE